MPLLIHCPRCNKELTAPDELIGKVAACPRCNTQFPVTVSARSSAPSLLSPGPAAGQAASSASSVAGTETSGPGSGKAEPGPRVPPGASAKTVASIPSNLPPVPGTGGTRGPHEDARRSMPRFQTPGAGVPEPAGLGKDRRDPSVASTVISPKPAPTQQLSPSNTDSASSSPAPSSSASMPLAPPSSASTSLASTSLASPSLASIPLAPSSGAKSLARKPAGGQSTSAPTAGSREAQPARFIAADRTDTRIHLGSDGRLPELVLQEGQKPESAEREARSSQPFRLIAVLAASFVALVWVLTVDLEGSRNESRRIAEARQQLEDIYARRTMPHHPPQEYQVLLSKALQAHNQGKYADEQRYYRRVLNLLRDEALQKDAANVKGLTGVRKGSVPSDEHLESLLSRLLSNY